MFLVPEYHNNVSLALASVLRDIGLNKRIVRRRRRTHLLAENMQTVSCRLIGKNMSSHTFGSQSEGTTTKGLNSDLDVLCCYHDTNVMQHWEEWTADVGYLRMIQDDTPPGYCRLQQIYSNVPLPVTEAKYGNDVKIGEDIVVLKSSSLHKNILQNEVRNRAAVTVHTDIKGYRDSVFVHAFPFKVLPNRVRTWIQSQMDNGRISREMKKYMESNPCYVVAVGSKASQHEAIEWRISTSHIERCLMFNLNVTQIQCCVMMKLILKSYLAHPHKMLSSFVCKNILLLCIEKTDAREWRPCNLLKMLSFCLHHLKLCVIHKTCPHFLIRENNLLAQKITTVEAHSWLYERVNLVLQCSVVSHLLLKIDDIGIRLQTKTINNGLKLVNNCYHAQDLSRSQEISVYLACYLSCEVSSCHKYILSHCLHQADVLHSLYGTVVKLHYLRCQFQRLACAPVKHLLYTDVGCAIASAGIQREYFVPRQALIWFQAGLNSDFASSRLKLASAFYCSGYLKKVAYILQNVAEKCSERTFVSICKCCRFRELYYYCGSRKCADNDDVLSLQNIALCVRFPKSEIYCVPEELRYEMFRSTREELLHRDDDDCWMDWAVVDSLPYLSFLQYKTYSLLGHLDAKQRALVNLFTIVSKERGYYGHRETAWNLLGLCFEQENRPAEAFQCYTISLSIRPNNNAARIHVIRLLIRRRNQH